MSQVSILGQREQGQDVRTQNIMAVLALSNIVKTSLGPQGLDKMLVDDIGDVTITNDGATILKQLEVTHPAAKVLVELSQIQDREVGDGTTSVVILAAELLKRGNELIKNNIPVLTMGVLRSNNNTIQRSKIVFSGLGKRRKSIDLRLF